MKYMIFVLTIAFLSCNTNMTNGDISNNRETFMTKVDSFPDTIKAQILPNGLQSFEVDDYPVTDEMFIDINESYKRQVGNVFSTDKVWLTNRILDQTLIFELHTDYHRMLTIHFKNQDIPDEIIERVQLYTSKGKFNNIFDLASFEQIKKSLMDLSN